MATPNPGRRSRRSAPPPPRTGRRVAIAVTLALATVGFMLWNGPSYPPRRDVPIDDWSALPARKRPVVDTAEIAGGIRVVTYNIHYGSGSRFEEDPMPRREEQYALLDEIVERIRALDPHIVALQEVDTASRRTFRIDQYRYIAQKLGMPYGAYVGTWELAFVPFPYWPPGRQFGRMRSGQAVLSRFPLDAHVRHDLPQPTENSWIYNRFYLHRALQTLEAKVPGVGPIILAAAHTEAYVTPNRNLHGRMIAEALAARRAGLPWILLGDLNATPPEAASRAGFVDEPDQDQREDDTIARYRAMPGAAEALPPERFPDGPSQWTFPAWAPNRRLDYIFYDSGAFEGKDGRVVTEAGKTSDHLPVIVTLLPRALAAAPAAEAASGEGEPAAAAPAPPSPTGSPR